MRRRITRLAVALLTFTAGLTSVASFRNKPPHAPDSALVENFHEHEAEFGRLLAMAREDSGAQIVQSSFVWLDDGDYSTPPVCLYADKPWPRPEAELGFNRRRWEEYRGLFGRLHLEGGLCRLHGTPGQVFLVASVNSGEFDGNETPITEKGYVYSPAPIHDHLTGSLDGIKLNRPAIFYKKLDGDWYLFYQWSASKPE